jgi:hypothetical protein
MVSPVNRASAIKALIGARMTIGLAIWTTPRITSKAFGIDVPGNPQLPYVARLFGARDVALACGVLSTEGDTQRQWLLAGVACDVADTLAGIAGARRGYLPKLTSALVTGTALSGVILGAAVLREQ